MRGGITSQSGEIGHVVLGDRGEMLGLDAGFCSLLRASADGMIGRGILEFTVPDDREPCRVGMARLRETGRAFTVRKRMMRGDGSHVWVEQATTQVRMSATSPAIVATFRPIARPADRAHPAALLEQGRFLADMCADRHEVLGSIFANPPWDLLLNAYVAEAEGRLADLAEMARRSRIPVRLAVRWARALVADGFFETEEGGDQFPEPVYRLTADAHARLEAYLSRRLDRLMSVDIAI